MRCERAFWRWSLATFLGATVRPHVEADPNRAFEMDDFDEDCIAVRAAIDARAATIVAQLDALGSRR